MGLARLKLKDSSSRAEKELEFLIDSGAVHRVAPGSILRELGIKAFKKASFILANGGSIERDVGGAFFIYEDHKGIAPVVSGTKSAKPLLSATTLEAPEWSLDRFRQELRPMTLSQMSTAHDRPERQSACRRSPWKF